MRSLLRELQATTIVRLRQARSPQERIAAIVASSFAPEQFTARCCAAWLAFYAQVPWSPQLARLHRVYVRRLRSNLGHAFRQCLPPERADRAAEGMSAMIDGIYVRAALLGNAADIDQAHTLANDYLRMALEHYAEVAANHTARSAARQ